MSAKLVPKRVSLYLWAYIRRYDLVLFLISARDFFWLAGYASFLSQGCPKSVRVYQPAGLLIVDLVSLQIRYSPSIESKRDWYISRGASVPSETDPARSASSTTFKRRKLSI